MIANRNSLVKNTVFAVVVLLISSFTTAKTTIKGTVYDNYVEVLENATIKLEDNEVKTNADGYFSLETEKTYPLTIEVSKEGYETKKVEITEPDEELEIVLAEEL